MVIGLADRPNSNFERIQRALREARDNAGLTGHQLDEQVSQARGTAHHYETDRRPTDRYLKKIAPALGIQDWRALKGGAALQNASRVKPVQREAINLVPYWGVVPCGNWEAPTDDDALIEIDERIDPTGVVAVRVSGDSMMPRLFHGQLVTIRLDPTPRDGLITLARSQDNELTLKVLQRRDGEWILQSINPSYGEATAEQWRILGHAVGVTEYDPAGLRA